MDEAQGLELTEGNIETVLDEIRPYLVGKTVCAANDALPNLAMPLLQMHLSMPNGGGMQSHRDCSSLNRMGQKAMCRGDRGIQRCSQSAESLCLSALLEH